MTRQGRALAALAACMVAFPSPTTAQTTDNQGPPRRTLNRGTLMRLTSDGRVPVRLAAAAATVTGRWLGQTGPDVVGAQGTLGPNGVCDILIELTGIPRREITSVTVKGHGAEQWSFPIPKNQVQYAAYLDRKPGAPTAVVCFEPLRVETGRQFYVKLTYDDGSETETYLKGGKADPNLRVAGTSVVAKWVGQGGLDFAGLGAGVGPDGLQDARVDLAKLSTITKVKAITLERVGPSGAKWSYGLNPELHHNAEFAPYPDDPSKGTVLFQPDADLARATLKLTVVYDNGKSDTTDLACQKTDPALAMPPVPLPKLVPLDLTARWHGQNRPQGFGPGTVHVSLAGIPAGRGVDAAVLSDGVRSAWVYRKSDAVALDVEPEARPLEVRKAAAPGAVELFFTPYRNLDGQPLTLRLVFDNGVQGVATLAGGAVDPALAAPTPLPGEVTARPGNDLQAAVGQYGTVNLSPGVYPLTRPLVLEKPVRLIGQPGAVLEFRQGAGDPPWTTAIKVHQGGTTLKGFGVRFAGPVRWRTEVSWGPAVIGTTDNLDGRRQVDKPGLVFEGLDLAVPQSSKTSGWEQGPKLFRLVDAKGGRIAGNTLYGGPVEFFGGPWVVEGNTYRGLPAHTFSPVVFAVHRPFELVFRNNRAVANVQGGKTWRFLLLTNRGFNDLIEKNVVEGIGPRDGDTIPAMNSPEIFLTESYHVRFEGKAAAVSGDGKLVRVPRLRGEPPVTGDVVSVLTGPDAGSFRRIAQRIDPLTYLLDAPLPAGSGAEVLSVAPGFVNDRYDGNDVDARNGRAAAGFVLAGNHYGTVVSNNRVVGAGDAYQIMAYPSESPVQWGWTHAPYLGGRIENNVVEDSPSGAQVGVLHNGNDKSSQGRVFMKVALKGNVVRWSDAFLAAAGQAERRPSAFVPGINLGWPPASDPSELVVSSEGDRLEGPTREADRPALRVTGAVLNGSRVVGRTFPLPLPQTVLGRSTAGTEPPAR